MKKRVAALEREKRRRDEALGKYTTYAELKAREVLDQAEQRRQAARAAELEAEQQRRGEALRFSRFKARKARNLLGTSNKILKKLKWNQAVCVLTSAVSEAIWHEGGERDDALATAEIVFHAICRDVNARFDGRENVVPFKRNPDYFKKKIKKKRDSV